MGSAIAPVESTPESCDTQQQTSTGLAYWRCSTNTVAFVADPDGVLHWAWVNDALVSWEGDSVDPPTDALVVAPSSADTSAGQTCVIPNTSEQTACPIATDGTATAGYIQSSGQSNAYRFDVTSDNTSITADLTTLPADYDLYLADGSGSLLGQSVQEGTTPEEIQSVLGPGTYYLFVHSDPARTFDPDNPYTLQLSVGAPGAQPTTAATGGVDQP
jgi:hypothetical protein